MSVESEIPKQNVPPSVQAPELGETPGHPVAAIGSTVLNSENLIQATATEQPADSEPTKEQKLDLAEKWLSAQNTQAEKGLVPADIASEISLVAQRQMNQLDDEYGIRDEEYYDLAATRDRAIGAADTLDFELAQLSGQWPLLARLNTMHHKFKQVSPEALSAFLGTDDQNYEYTALYIRNIIADHAPALLTEDLKALVDPSQSLWRASSAQASILLRHSRRSNIGVMQVEQVPTSLPVSGRVEYKSEDDSAMKPLSAMTDEELALYCKPEYASAVKERGYAQYDELNLPTRETLLTRRIFEAVAKSNDEESRRFADERNRAAEHEPILQQGDFVHATRSTAVLSSILANGLRCGEAIMGNDRDVIKYPYTVSFLEVDENIAQHDSAPARFKAIRTEGYGAIHLVLDRGPSSTDYVRGQKVGVLNQRQIFGGVPSTEVKRIIIRDEGATPETTAAVIQEVVKKGVFIPVYKGSTGEVLLTSEQFDQSRKAYQE